jgi:hypothetical protein
MAVILQTLKSNNYARGRAFIAGTGKGLVTVAGRPAGRRIFVYEQVTMRFARTIRSQDDGSYRIDGLSPEMEYLVVAIDDKRIFNAVVRSHVLPVMEGS